MATSTVLTPAQVTPKKKSIRTTVFFETLGLLALTVLIVAVAAFFLARRELTLRVTSQLQSIAESKETLIETTVARQREQVSTLAHDPELRALPLLTELVGFQYLLRVGTGGTVTLLSGDNAAGIPEGINRLEAVDGTVFRPIITEQGWKQYVIAAPQTLEGQRTGTIVAVFDATLLGSRLLSAGEAGKSAEVLLVNRADGETMILLLDGSTGRAVPLRNPDMRFTAISEALDGNEGISETVDYAGIRVLSAYRSVPSLGWGVIAKIDRYEITAPLIRLAFNIGGIGLMAVVFLALISFVMAGRIVGPLEVLTRKLRGLETKRWSFEKTIATGNELEEVDEAADDLTRRLRRAYEHLEDMVKERTEALHMQLAKDDAILQSMDDGLLVTDADGNVAYMNPIAEMLTGRTGAERGSALSVLKILTKDGRQLQPGNHPVSIVLATKARYAPDGDPQFRLVHANGKESALQIRATPILRGKNCEGVVTVIRDVSEERRIDLMKSEFISLVSHQLRTPLSSMRWYLEMLIADEGSTLTAEQRDCATQAVSSNARMVHLVNALLNVSRIELGKFQVSPESIDLEELSRAVAATFDLESKQKHIQFAYEIPGARIAVQSDKGLLMLILENLVSNAVKYSRDGSTVTIGIALDAEGKHARLFVKDTGIGIPQNEQKDIGRRLFRAENAKAIDTDGNGLGLYVSRVAAESIGGNLTFESREKEGSTFTLTIPLEPKTSKNA